MKKAILLFASSILLIGCNQKREDLIPLLSFCQSGELLYLDSTQLSDCKEKKASFVLYVYQGTCQACDNFAYVLKDFVSSYKKAIAYTPLGEFEKSSFSLSLSESSLLFLKDGKIMDYTTDFSSFGSKKDFASFLKNKVEFSEIEILNPTSATPTDSPFETYTFSDFDFDTFQEKDSYSFLILGENIDYSTLKSITESERLNGIILNGNRSKNLPFSFSKEDVSIYHYQNGKYVLK